MSEKIIEFRKVNKYYGKFHALKDINFSVNKEFVWLISIFKESL